MLHTSLTFANRDLGHIVRLDLRNWNTDSNEIPKEFLTQCPKRNFVTYFAGNYVIPFFQPLHVSFNIIEDTNWLFRPTKNIFRYNYLVEPGPKSLLVVMTVPYLRLGSHLCRLGNCAYFHTSGDPQANHAALL